jgi:hypothetical protein
VAASGLRLGGEQECMWTGPHQTRSGHVSVPDPRLGPVQGPGVFCPGTLGPHCGWPGPHTGGSGSHSRGPACTRGGPGPILGVRTIYLGVRRSPVGSGLTVDALEYHLLWTRDGFGPACVVKSGAAVDPEQSPETGASHGLVPHTAP